jgi:hypothetical protein
MREIALEIREGVPEALERATSLIGPELRAETGPIHNLIAKCKAEGNYAFWMDSLFWVSGVAEELNLDAQLPPEFWHCLEFAAQKMQFPQFIPQTRGKAVGRPARGLCDYLAAVVIIHREVGTRWAESFPDRADLLDKIVSGLKAVNPEYPNAIKSEPAPALARRFVDDGWLEDPPPKKFHPVRLGLGQLFHPIKRGLADYSYPLFDFVNAPWFPDSLADERWSVIAFNYFRVKIGGGLFPLKLAKPWWME